MESDHKVKSAHQQISELKQKGWLEPKTKTHNMFVYFEVLGTHTHLHIWTGELGTSRGKAGNLVMTNAEFEAWRNGSMQITYVQKEKE